MKHTRFLSWMSLALLVAVFAACGGDDPDDMDTTAQREMDTPTQQQAEALRVVDVSLGTSIDANRRITSSTDDFAPTDTIYASVQTEGMGSGATLMARWTYEDGQVVDESSQTVSSTGPAYTEFHISMPEGLPTGEYQVEIMMNGQSVETEDFEIE